MVYEPPVYPAAIPTTIQLPDRSDDVDWLYAARYNELKKELRAALIELGVLPKGTSATIAERLKGVRSLSDAIADALIIKGNNVGIGVAAPTVPLAIKTIANKGIRLIESSGVEYYDVEIAANGDLVWRNDVGNITMRLADYDGGMGARFGIGPHPVQPVANLDVIGVVNNVNFRIRTSAASWFMLVMGADDGLRWCNNPVAGQSNSNTIFTNFDNKQKDHDHSDLQTDPTVIIHSDTDVDVHNTEWGSLSFKGTGGGGGYFKILTGVGDLALMPVGNVGIGTTAPKSKLHVVGLPVYANNAAAIVGGLTVGAFYRTGADPDPVCVVH